MITSSDTSMVSDCAPQNKASGISARHQEVLDAAMALIAERGLKGASLRELARRVAITQPSLYHYFSSKDDLVGQIIAEYSARAMARAPVPVAISSLRELLVRALEYICTLYGTSAHVTWVRFLFAVTMERPEFGGLLQDVFIERGMALGALLAKPAVTRGDVRAEDVIPALQLAVGALTMRLLEKRVMRTAPPNETTDDESAFIAFVVDTVASGVKSRRHNNEGNT